MVPISSPKITEPKHSKVIFLSSRTLNNLRFCKESRPPPPCDVWVCVCVILVDVMRFVYFQGERNTIPNRVACGTSSITKRIGISIVMFWAISKLCNWVSSLRFCRQYSRFFGKLRASILPHETKFKVLSDMTLGQSQTFRIAQQSQCASTIGVVNPACVPDDICFQQDDSCFQPGESCSQPEDVQFLDLFFYPQSLWSLRILKK